MRAFRECIVHVHIQEALHVRMQPSSRSARQQVNRQHERKALILYSQTGRTDRQVNRQTLPRRQTDSQTDRRDRKTCIQADSEQKEVHADVWTDRDTDIGTDRRREIEVWTNRETEREADREEGRQTDRQIDRQERQTRGQAGRYNVYREADASERTRAANMI